MDVQLKAQCGQTIGLRTITAMGAGRSPTYGSLSSVSARVVEKYEEHDGPSGTKISTTHVILTEDAITNLTRIWLPGDSTSDYSLAREPKYIRVAYDEDGSADYYVTRV